MLLQEPSSDQVASCPPGGRIQLSLFLSLSWPGSTLFLFTYGLSKRLEGSKARNPPLQHNCCLLLLQSRPCEPTPPSSLQQQGCLHKLLISAALDCPSPAALYGSGCCVPARQLPPLQVPTHMALQDCSSLHATGSPRLQNLAHSCLQPGCLPPHRVDQSILFQMLQYVQDH